LQALLEGKQAQGMLAEAEYKELPGQEDWIYLQLIDLAPIINN
jgi:hypothetical protein